MVYASDALFPLVVSKQSRGGPRMSLSVTESDSGGQERARRWPTYRWEYDAGIGLRTLDSLNSAYGHFLAVGPDVSFPFRDYQDYTSRSDNRSDPTTTPGSSLDQIIGVGDGSRTTFQLTKTYTFGQRSYIRNIRKPEPGTVVVSVGGVIKTLGTDYLLDTSTGVIVFQPGQVPGGGGVVRASYKFYVPVFYDGEFDFKASLEAIDAGRVNELLLVEDVSQGALTPDFIYKGGGISLNISTDEIYSYDWGISVFLTPSVDGLSVILPDINDLPFGGPYQHFTNGATSGPKTITFKDRSTGSSVFSLAFSKGAVLYVRKDTGGVRAWNPLLGA